MDAATIQNWLVTKLAEELGVDTDEIEVDAPMEEYGLNSAQAMGLMSQSEQFLGFEVSPVLLWHYPTIESLSARLAEDANNQETIEI